MDTDYEIYNESADSPLGDQRQVKGPRVKRPPQGYQSWEWRTRDSVAESLLTAPLGH